MLGDLVICVRIKGFCYLYKYIKLLGFFFFLYVCVDGCMFKYLCKCYYVNN